MSLWLPETKSPIFCIHGSKDQICDLEDSFKLIGTQNPTNIMRQLLIIDDTHSLNSLCSTHGDNLITYIENIIELEQSQLHYGRSYIHEDPWIMWKLTPSILMSYPFWLTRNLRMPSRIDT